MERSQIITLILAIWGALLASITFGWNLYRDLSKRGRLRVTCYIGNIINAPGGKDPKDYLVWNVTNIGGEMVVLTHIGGAFNNGKHFMLNAPSLPKTLKPGEYLVEYSSDLSALDSRLEALWAADSVGHTFKARRKQVRGLKRQYASGAYQKEVS